MVWNMFKVNNKNTRKTSLTSLWCFRCQLWTYLNPFWTVLIVNFEKASASWLTTRKLYSTCAFHWKSTTIKLVKAIRGEPHIDFCTQCVIMTLVGGGLLLTLSWRRPLSYRNQSSDLGSKSMDWFLYDSGLRHERVMTFWKWETLSNLEVSVLLQRICAGKVSVIIVIDK